MGSGLTWQVGPESFGSKLARRHVFVSKRVCDTCTAHNLNTAVLHVELKSYKNLFGVTVCD